jgi:hypothetical protein
LTQISLPGGGKIGVYEPRHPRPKWSRSSRRRKSPKRRTARKGSAASR